MCRGHSTHSCRLTNRSGFNQLLNLLEMSAAGGHLGQDWHQTANRELGVEDEVMEKGLTFLPSLSWTHSTTPESHQGTACPKRKVMHLDGIHELITDVFSCIG